MQTSRSLSLFIPFFSSGNFNCRQAGILIVAGQTDVITFIFDEKSIYSQPQRW